MSNPLEKLKPSRYKKEIITFTLISVISISFLVFFTYQENIGSITSQEVPLISIKISNDITNDSQQCFLKITPISQEFTDAPWANRNLPASIRQRASDGGMSFELYQREKLFNIRDDDDWLLLPSGDYLNALRTKLAFDTYNMLAGNSSNKLLPRSKIIEVYVNGEYKGLYLLSERIDRKFMNLDQENTDNPEDNDMIFKITDWEGDFFTIPDSLENQWEQIYPNTLNFSQIPVLLTQYILNSSETMYFDNDHGIFTILDEDLVIDNLLFGLLLGHESIEGASFYMIYNHKSSPGFFFLPWNFEQSWGFSKYGTIPLELWLNNAENRVESIVWSKLYERLLFPENSTINTEFIIKVRNRWNEIRSNFWSTGNLISYFNEIYVPIINSLIRSTNNINDVSTTVERIKDWITTRGNLLDTILNEQQNLFFNSFEPPYQEDDEILGFSNPTARRYYYKSSRLFSKEKIHDISITIRHDYFEDMLERKHDNSRWSEHFYMPSEIVIDGYSMNNVGMRVRGNYNRIYPKDSFKFKFCETDLYLGNYRYDYYPEYENRRFLGLKRINLRAAPVDFSFMNEVAGYEIFKLLGIPYTRLSWAKLFFTEIDSQGNIVTPEEYKGLYLLTENIDKTFLRYNFKNPEGNLYKTTEILANLEYRHDLKAYYTWDQRRVYELRTNEELDDYSDLQRFVGSINYNWSDIGNIANIDLIARYFAASNFQGNWDDYVFLPHNFYLYSEPNSGFILIPWDIEQNLNQGSMHAVISHGAPDFRYAPLLEGYKGYYDGISEWAGISPDNRPFWDNLIVDPIFRVFYLYYQEFLVNITDNLISQLEQWFDMIELTVQIPFEFTDPNSPVAWYPNQIPYYYFNVDKNRVLDFISDRRDYVESQLP